MNNLHIITVATHSQYYFPYLVESVKKYGKELEVLGFNEKWLGFNWKFKKMLLHLSTLSNDDIVCFIDGYDVLCLRNLDELANKFIEIKNRTNRKMIIGYDNVQSKIHSIFASIYFGKYDNKSLNSGTYIGYTKDVINILNNILKLNQDDDADDQILMTKYCNLNKNEIYIDINNELFLTLDAPLRELSNYVDINNNKLKYNNEYPFFIHACGGGYLDNTLIKLNYKLYKPINTELSNNHYKKKAPVYIKLVIKHYYKQIILTILILIIIYKLIKSKK
jgi:hypothetical protein